MAKMYIGIRFFFETLRIRRQNMQVSIIVGIVIIEHYYIFNEVQEYKYSYF